MATALLRGQADRAAANGGAVMEWFSALPLWLIPTGSVQIRALQAMGRAAESVQVAERILATIAALGGAGHSEVELRLAASESLFAVGATGRAHSELRETL